MSRRIVIAGIPRAGKTTAALGIHAKDNRPVVHLDDLIGTRGWSELSTDAAQTLLNRPGSYVMEGVQTPRALRKLLLMDAPAAKDLSDLTVYWYGKPRQPLTPGQESMAKGCATVWDDIRDVLVQRGATVLEQE